MDVVMKVRNGVDGAATAELLARLEALALRLDEQAVEIAELKAEKAERAVGIARLTAQPAVSTPEAVGTAKRVGRRGMLQKAVAATAAAALLTVAKEAPTTHAASRTTLLSGIGSAADVGLIATYGADDPLSYLPNLNGASFSVIGPTCPRAFRRRRAPASSAPAPAGCSV